MLLGVLIIRQPLYVHTAHYGQVTYGNRPCTGSLDALRGADARPQTFLALAPDRAMLAYLRSPAFLARAFPAHAGVDARPQARHAPAPQDPRHAMHRLLSLFGAYAINRFLRSPALLAPALDAFVGTDARPQARLAPTPFVSPELGKPDVHQMKGRWRRRRVIFQKSILTPPSPRDSELSLPLRLISSD